MKLVVEVKPDTRASKGFDPTGERPSEYVHTNYSNGFYAAAARVLLGDATTIGTHRLETPKSTVELTPDIR